MESSFTPALGRFGMARLYDPVMKLSREGKWRGAAIRHFSPQPGDDIADIGCGTGTLASLIAMQEPQAKIIGVDPDPEILGLARQKVSKSNFANIEWRQGMGDKLVDVLGAQSVGKIISSLVLHQCALPMKRAILESMHQVLRPGGKLVIADFRLQRTALMRMAFRIIQFTDGKEDTQPNADGMLPELIAQAGFVDVTEKDVINTAGGSISIYVAHSAK